MRFVNADGRAALLVGDQVFDVEKASSGRLPADPMEAVRNYWDDLRTLAAEGALAGGVPLGDVTLGPPVPVPGAVYAIGVNYQSHADEVSHDVTRVPPVFTKFPSAVVGPTADVILPPGDHNTDWEAELCFVVARGGRRIPAADALDHLAGFMCSQDVSERLLQFSAGNQFSLGKSYDTFCPTGPAIVTLDELVAGGHDPADLGIQCRKSGEIVQDARTSEMIVDVPHLVELLSRVLTLRPGDICLTGTPAGVGWGRTPKQRLEPGDVVETTIEGLGTLTNHVLPPDA
jgi:2-keto-4-pentenoate hydratase/2-oxohepta-3-ene-1,7-dioic acid hydratase in catechol pathway